MKETQTISFRNGSFLNALATRSEAMIVFILGTELLAWIATACVIWLAVGIIDYFPILQVFLTLSIFAKIGVSLATIAYLDRYHDMRLFQNYCKKANLLRKEQAALRAKINRTANNAIAIVTVIDVIAFLVLLLLTNIFKDRLFQLATSTVTNTPSIAWVLSDFLVITVGAVAAALTLMTVMRILFSRNIGELIFSAEVSNGRENTADTISPDGITIVKSDGTKVSFDLTEQDLLFSDKHVILLDKRDNVDLYSVDEVEKLAVSGKDIEKEIIFRDEEQRWICTTGKEVYT